MPKIAIATCKRLPDLDPNDRDLIPAFEDLGFDAIPVDWKNPKVEWDSFEFVLIRNTWDYYTEADNYSSWIRHLEKLDCIVLNDTKTIKNNLHKFYLNKLINKGIPVVPTLFSSKNKATTFEELKAKNWEKFIIKPAISAGSYKTECFELKDISSNDFDSRVAKSDWLIQPFMSQILTEGEVSLIFFSGKFSHAVCKKPKAGEFRIQKQYGGIYEAFTPEQSLIDAAEKVVIALDENPLFVRVDGLMVEGTFLLMEAEMIEPDLYMHLAPNAHVKLAELAIMRYEKIAISKLVK